jgi:hypothetical protein
MKERFWTDSSSYGLGETEGGFGLTVILYSITTSSSSSNDDDRIRNKKTHNKGHILDRQIKHALKSGASDQISQWMVKIWTVGIRQ